MMIDLELSAMRFDFNRIVNEICMDENKNEMYFLVEGTSDRDVYVKFVDKQKVSFIICNSKENVFKIYDGVKQNQGHGSYVYAIVDMDYDLHFGCLRKDSHILYTDSHDLEIMILYSDVFEHIAKGIYSNQKLLDFGSIEYFRNYISGLCIRLGLFRIINIEKGLCLRLKANIDKDKEFPYQKFISKGVFLGDEALLNTIKIYNKQPAAFENRELINAMEAIPRSDNDEHLILHGHDVTSVMALLTKKYGKKGLDINNREQVELNFRLAYSFDCFKQTKLFEKIMQLADMQNVNIWKYKINV